MTRPVGPDRLAALEEERRFLLRSLADLEREHDAGDVDEIDYHELRDTYTARAAAVLRVIDGGRSALPARRPVSWRRRIAGAVALLAAIGLVWWVLAVSSAQRLPGQQLTGLDPRDETQVLMSQARSIQATDPAAAAALYDQVLVRRPDDVEALTYRGWTLALASIGQSDQAVIDDLLGRASRSLVAAIEADPTYPDPFCFLGIVQYRFYGQAELALTLLDGCLAAGPPADVRGLVESLRASVVAAVDAAAPAVTSPDTGG
ncbi:MAG TPA: hypothetical protein VIS05_05525 [Ilumatobacter sp.]